MPATNETALTVLDSFVAAYRERDITALAALFTADAFAYGTGSDEKAIGREAILAQFHRDWAQSSAASFELHACLSHLRGEGEAAVAWVAADCTLRFTVEGQDGELPGRVVGVLERREDRWQFSLLHVAVPLANQDAGQSFPEGRS
jgi:ketosteroid isomerase-like protein